jgi:hypothetical protein
MAKVSICITAYQHGSFIAECITSVLMQRTTHELEILVGEDGSTDRTAEICEDLARRDARIRVISGAGRPKWKIDGHITGRRNCFDLFAHATGEYLALLDGDDGWLGMNKVQAQVDLLEAEHTLAGSYHHTLVVDEEGRTMGRMRKELPSHMDAQGTMGMRAPFHTSSFIWRNTPATRALIMDRRGRRAGSFDMYIFTSVALQGPLRCIDGDLSFYRKHGGGITEKGLFHHSNIQRLRIMQWLRFLPDLGAAGRAEAIKLCDKHLDAVRGMAMSLRDKVLWLVAMLSFPSYFLGNVGRFRLLLSLLIRAPRPPRPAPSSGPAR